MQQRRTPAGSFVMANFGLKYASGLRYSLTIVSRPPYVVIDAIDTTRAPTIYMWFAGGVPVKLLPLLAIADLYRSRRTSFGGLSALYAGLHWLNLWLCIGQSVRDGRIRPGVQEGMLTAKCC